MAHIELMKKINRRNMEKLGACWVEQKRNLCSEERDECDDIFARRMCAAGLTPAAHIGIAVSGGPDSTAICILVSRWIQQEGGPSGIVMGFVVDHGLRAESSSEALLVQTRVFKLGIRCEVLKCSWPDGVPAQGHLQEAARNARYELLQNACNRNGMDVLLTAHHADDQMELFIIRLSRHSGLAGLAGMPFVSNVFRCIPDHTRGNVIHRILLVRPLLDFNKGDLYKVCRKHTQPWIEDPTNDNLVFLRNVVRKFLNKEEFSLLRKDLQHVIMLCQKMRTLFDKGRDLLLLKAVSIDQDFGYAVMDLEKLKLSEENKQFLSRALVAIMQFVAQKEKPPRGKVVQMLVDHIHSGHLKGALTLAGCNICMAPGSKGSQLLICASCDSKAPVSAEPVNTVWECDHNHSSESGTLLQVMAEASTPGISFDENTFETGLHTRFTNVKDPAQLLCEAKQAGILSDRSTLALSKLLDELSMESADSGEGNLQKKTEKHFSGSQGKPTDLSLGLQIPCGHACYFMNRFWIAWGKNPKNMTESEEKLSVLQLLFANPIQCCRIQSYCPSLQHTNALWVRYMNEKDWVFLSQCAEQGLFVSHGVTLHGASKCCRISGTDLTNLNPEGCGKDGSLQRASGLPCCLNSWAKKAQEALAKLKSIPLPVRRGLPVFVTAQGALLGIPSLRLSLCPNIWVSSSFSPRVPLGGGHALWL